MAQHTKVWMALAGVGLILPTLVTWVYFDWLATSSPQVQQTAYGLGKAIQFALPLLAWWQLRRALKHPPAVADEAGEAFVPSPSSQAWPVRYLPSLGWGLVSGLVIGASILTVYHYWLIPSGMASGAIDAAEQKITSMGLKSKGVFLGVALFYSLCHSGLEEYYWRWFVFRHLHQRWSLAGAIVVSSLGFMSHHVLVLARYFGWASPLTYAFALGVAVGGVIWAGLYRRYGTLLGPWLSHALVDAAIFVIAWQMIDWN